jgi:hypothetical protein
MAHKQSVENMGEGGKETKVQMDKRKGVRDEDMIPIEFQWLFSTSLR